MIGYIKGKATIVSKEFCFIEAGDIGYRVFISEMSRQKIHLGTPVRLLTYMAVREDAILLYGFLTQEEYDLFLILISVSKIGPKVAMGILSVMEPADFVLSIRNRNLSVLTKLPGVGKRTAERLLVELKDKVGDFAEGDIDEPESLAAGKPDESGIAANAAKYLRALGYEDTEIQPVLKKLSIEYKDVSPLVSAALREFGKQ